METDGSERQTPELYGEEEMARIEAHIERYFGKFDHVFHELVSPDIHVDIVLIGPRAEHDYYTLVTMGMGAHRMRMPEEMQNDGLDRAELLINLPPDWSFDTLDDEQLYWPMRWLKVLARLPGDSDTWLGWGHTVPTGGPLAGTDFRCTMLLNPGAFSGESALCEMPDGSVVNFYQVVPLYEDEMEYKLECGTDELLKCLPHEALEVTDPERPNFCADADPLRGVPFAERIRNFWDWFRDHEQALSEMVERRTGDNAVASADVVSFVAEGTNLIGREVFFNIGGDYEFTFSVEGRSYLFYLLPALVDAMPERYRGKWHFSPWMPGSGGDFAIDIYGAHAAANDAWVGMDTGGDDRAASLRFYAPGLADLEEDLRHNAFRILMNHCIGEALSYSFVKDVVSASAKEDGMFPLTELGARLTALFAEADGTQAGRPDARYFTYTLEPEADAELRRDIYTGVGSYAELVSDYYAGDDETFRRFRQYGAQPVFLFYYPDPNAEQRASLDERYAIQERLEAEVLNPGDDAEAIGIALGGAMGDRRIYIDLLLYDRVCFVERARPLLEELGYLFYLAEFCAMGDVEPLFGEDTPDLFDKLVALHDAGAPDAVVEAVDALPEVFRSYELVGLTGRALNNMQMPGRALEVLSSIAERGETDPVWHYRIGYSYYYLNREEEAAEHFQRAVDLGMDDDDTREFLRSSLIEAADRAAFARRRSVWTPSDPDARPFDGFDFGDFWDDDAYALAEYVGSAATDEAIAEAETALGYTLPPSYVWLMKRHNGGVPFNCAFPSTEPTSWADDHVAISGIMGVDPERRYSLCGELGSAFMIGEWGYPEIGVAICDCPSAGHDMIFLDYRFCGPGGEPEVVHVDQEDDYRITFLADDFETFVRGLRPAAEFEEDEM